MSFRDSPVLLWGKLTAFLLDLLYPPRCVVCRRVDTWLCAPCVEQLPWLDGAVCERCGIPIKKGKICPSCQRIPPSLEGIRSAFLFDGPLRTAVHHLKYRRGRQLADTLGELLTRYWQKYPLPVDVIVPVPLHPTRLRQRGYNQATLLAQELGYRVGLPVDEPLRRVRATASQMRLSAVDRQQNVRGAFRCQAGWAQERRILLVDDVCTTGATLEACADALREEGAEAIWGLTLARAP